MPSCAVYIVLSDSVPAPGPAAGGSRMRSRSELTDLRRLPEFGVRKSNNPDEVASEGAVRSSSFCRWQLSEHCRCVKQR